MITVSSLSELHALTQLHKAVLACGVFDGVHKGHQKLLKAVREMAARHQAMAVALTFEPHPRTVLEFDTGPPRLTNREQKVEHLHHYGAEAVVVLDFNRQLAALSASEFLRDFLLSSEISLCGIVVGRNWRFGAHGQGDLNYLTAAGRRHGFEVAGIPEQKYHGELISSTRIRELIKQGELSTAANMLGRHYSVRGKVRHGKGIGKSQVGHATANIDSKEMLLPPPGVYAAAVRKHIADEAPGSTNEAIAYIGSAPTIHGNNQSKIDNTLEVHILGCDTQLYGAELDVSFISFIRKERCFESVDALRHQIKADIEIARNVVDALKSQH